MTGAEAAPPSHHRHGKMAHDSRDSSEERGLKINDASLSEGVSPEDDLSVAHHVGAWRGASLAALLFAVGCLVAAALNPPEYEPTFRTVDGRQLYGAVRGSDRLQKVLSGISMAGFLTALVLWLQSGSARFQHTTRKFEAIRKRQPGAPADKFPPVD